MRTSLASLPALALLAGCTPEPESRQDLQAAQVAATDITVVSVSALSERWSVAEGWEPGRVLPLGDLAWDLGEGSLASRTAIIEDGTALMFVETGREIVPVALGPAAAVR